jgi:hypothetical protein
LPGEELFIFDINKNNDELITTDGSTINYDYVSNYYVRNDGERFNVVKTGELLNNFTFMIVKNIKNNKVTSFSNISPRVLMTEFYKRNGIIIEFNMNSIIIPTNPEFKEICVNELVFKEDNSQFIDYRKKFIMDTFNITEETVNLNDFDAAYSSEADLKDARIGKINGGFLERVEYMSTVTGRLFDIYGEIPKNVINESEWSLLELLAGLLQFLSYGLNDPFCLINFVNVLKNCASTFQSAKSNMRINQSSLNGLRDLIVTIESQLVDAHNGNGFIPTIKSRLQELSNPLNYSDKIRRLRRKYPEVVNNYIYQMTPQDVYEELNEHSNQLKTLDVSRSYQMDDCFISFDEYTYDSKYKDILKQDGFDINIKRFEIIDSRNFIDTPPREIYFCNTRKNVDNFFHIIWNNSYLKFPTYRQTCRYSRNLTSYDIEINKAKFPKESGGSNTSNNRSNFLFSRLSNCMDINSSCLNNTNTSLDVSSSLYITKKLYEFYVWVQSRNNWEMHPWI